MKVILRAWSEIVVFIKGMLLGIANVVPGLSGGTIAVVMGIYDRLIAPLSGLSAGIIDKPGLVYVGKLLLGAGVAIQIFSGTIEFALKEHFHMTMFFFLGLIIGGIPHLVAEREDMKLTLPRALVFLIAAAALGAFVIWGGFKHDAHPAIAIGPSVFGLFFAGFLAGAAMIVPGISGSLVLVIMGKYEFLISSVRNFDIMPILIAGCGALIGIMALSRIIKMLLEIFSGTAYYFILGLIAVSCVRIFPGMPPGGMSDVFIAFVVFLLGSALSHQLARVSGMTAGRTDPDKGQGDRDNR